jgi:hypothetical protein
MNHNREKKYQTIKFETILNNIEEKVLYAKLSEAMSKFGFTAAIKWTGGEEAKFEAGLGSWADLSKS